MLMQQTITNLLLTVHALTVIQQWIQQLVKSQMKVGMRLTQTERLVRRMPTMVLLPARKIKSGRRLQRAPPYTNLQFGTSAQDNRLQLRRCVRQHIRPGVH